MWKLHIDCFQHCTCFVETLLKIAYKRTLNYVYITFIFKCFNNLSVGKAVYCYEIHSVFSWPMLKMWNDVFWRHIVRANFPLLSNYFYYYLKQESSVKKSKHNYNLNSSVKLIFVVFKWNHQHLLSYMHTCGEYKSYLWMKNRSEIKIPCRVIIMINFKLVCVIEIYALLPSLHHITRLPSNLIKILTFFMLTSIRLSKT